MIPSLAFVSRHLRRQFWQNNTRTYEADEAPAWQQIQRLISDTDAFGCRDHFHWQMVIASLRTYLIIALFFDIVTAISTPTPMSSFPLSHTHTHSSKALTLKWCKIFRFNLDCDTATVLLRRALYINRY